MQKKLIILEFLEITDMLPGILNQLGPESLTHLKKLANNVTSQFKSPDDEVPGMFSLRCSESIGCKTSFFCKHAAIITTICFNVYNGLFSDLVGDFDEASKNEVKADDKA